MQERAKSLMAKDAALLASYGMEIETKTERSDLPPGRYATTHRLQIAMAALPQSHFLIQASNIEAVRDRTGFWEVTSLALQRSVAEDLLQMRSSSPTFLSCEKLERATNAAFAAVDQTRTAWQCLLFTPLPSAGPLLQLRDHSK